jgi:hypothetical protein
MATTKYLFLAISILILTMPACSPALRQTKPTAIPTQMPTSTATQVVQPVSTQPPANLPQTDAEVPRVPVDQAKAAVDSGEAIIVDVRGPAAFEASHVAGARSISLGEIETNPTGLDLDKNQWIITYCT